MNMSRRHGGEGAMAAAAPVSWDQDSISDKEEDEELDERYRYKSTVSRDYERSLNKGRRYRRKTQGKFSCLRYEQWLIIGVTLFMCVLMFVVGLRLQAKRHSYALPWNEGQQSEIDVDWPEYMKKLDPLWTWARYSDAPSSYDNSPFMGNGNLGLTVRVDSDETNKIRFDIGRSDIYFGAQRFPVGCLWVDLSETTKASVGSLRTRLWDAVTSGSIGNLDPISLESFVHAEKDVILISLKTPASFNHEKYITFQPGYYGNPNPPKVRPEKPPVCTQRDSYNICTQELSGSTNNFAVVWTIVTDVNPASPQIKSVYIYLTVSPVGQLSGSKALAMITEARSNSYEDLLGSHKAWWNSYYPSSFVTLDNITMESFYWIQMYKIASATRGDKNLIDMHGPWLKDDAPNGSSIDWVTGIHLSYSALYPANRLPLGLSLHRYITKYTPIFIRNVPESYRKIGLAAPSGLSGIDGHVTCAEPENNNVGKVNNDVDINEEEEEEEGERNEMGNDGGECKAKPPAPTSNIMLACYNLWLQYSYSQDRSLISPLISLLGRAIEYSSRLSRPGPRGYLQFPAIFTPGYPEKKGENSNYDIALYKWALRTYIQLKKELGDDDTKGTYDISLSEALLKESRTPPFTTTDSGDEYTIAEGVQVDRSSPSFSHLYMVYPLSDLTNLSDKKDALRASKTVSKWVTKLSENPEHLAYSRPILSMISSFLGDKNSAYRNITRFIGRALSPNTFYVDSIGDTRLDLPLAASNALHSMFLLSSDAGEIRIFPGTDSIFMRKAAFWHLRAHKGILVSSRLGRNGEPEFVELVNPTGASVNVTVVHGFSSGFKVYSHDVYNKNVSPKATALRIPPGKNALLVNKKKSGDITITPIPGSYWDKNPWGIRK